MKKIVLIYPEYSYPRKNPPMGLAYIASYLEHNKFNPVILDYNVDLSASEKLTDLLSSSDVIFAGISFMTNQFGSALKIADKIKEYNSKLPVVVGGPHVSAIPEQTLTEMKSVDIVCYGEGEETSLGLAKAFDCNLDSEAINGIVFRKGNTIQQNEPQPLFQDIDRLPFPAWHLIDLFKYSVFGGDLNKPTFAILSSRGCPAHCIFCDSHTVFSRCFRGRSAENIYSEIQYLHDTYDMEQFDFVDDLITFDKKRILAFCDLLKQSKTKYQWMANARVNTVDEEMLIAMKDAGCIRLDFGVESGDPKVQKIIKKGVSNEKIISAHRLAQTIGIATSTFLMVGNIGETFESVKKTAKLMKPIAMDTNIAIACPFPGTELYQIAKKNGWLRVNDWSNYVTSPTYQPGYKPVMVTDVMDQKQILNAYYYLHSVFVKKKFQARYGRFFIFNSYFWKQWVFKASSEGGYFRKFSMAFQLFYSKLTALFIKS